MQLSAQYSFVQRNPRFRLLDSTTKLQETHFNVSF